MIRHYVNLFFLVFVLFSQRTMAENELHLFAPGLQYRFENDSDQSTKNRRYDNYNIAGIIFDDYLIGAELNLYDQETSSGSLKISENFQEENLYFGYFFYSKMFNEKYKIALDLGPVVYIGQNHSTVETTIGSASQKSEGENNLVYGLGLQATLRLSYVLLQPEIRYATARSYQPGSVPIYGVRLGFRIGF